MSVENGLKKCERITSQITLEHLFNKGKKIFEYPYKVFYDFNLGTPLDCELEMAISVPKKRIRKAHNRNRIKRLTREGYRTNKLKLIKELAQNKQRLSVFLIFVGTADVNLAQVEEKIIVILNRLQEELRNLS